jgi:hypothetical protein
MMTAGWTEVRGTTRYLLHYMRKTKIQKLKRVLLRSMLKMKVNVFCFNLSIVNYYTIVQNKFFHIELQIFIEITSILHNL